MSFYSKLRGTFENIFRIGKGGPQIKNSSGVLEMRNAADVAYVITRGLDPVGAQDYVTKTYFDSNNAGAGGVQTATITFDVTGADTAGSPKVSTGTIPDNAVVHDCRLDVKTIMNVGTDTLAVSRTGGGASIAIGGDSDLSIAGTYSVPQQTSWGATGAGTVTLTSTGTSTTGVVDVIIFYSTPTNIT